MAEEKLKTVQEQLTDVKNFHKWRWRVLVIWNIVMGITLVVVSGALVQNQKRINDLVINNQQLVGQNRAFIMQIENLAQNHRTVLCGLKKNVEDRIQFQKDILAGRRPPIAGVTRSEIRRSLRSDDKALDDFRKLRCGRNGRSK